MMMMPLQEDTAHHRYFTRPPLHRLSCFFLEPGEHGAIIHHTHPHHQRSRHHHHHHQHHHHHHHHHRHQLFNDLQPDNRSCFTSGQRFPVTIASLCGRGQEPVDHPQAGGLCQEEGGASQEAAGGRGQEEGEDGEDLKSIWALLP